MLVCISCIANASREQLQICSSANQVWVCSRTITTTPLASNLTASSSVVKVNIEVVIEVTSNRLIISIGIDSLIGCNLNCTLILTWSKYQIESLSLCLRCANSVWSSQSSGYAISIATCKGQSSICAAICKVCSELTCNST